MGKFIVTGLHSSGKSAFIRSFANDNDAKLFENISQSQRSTRFIAEYCFEKDCELSLEVTFKSGERVVEEVFENLVNSICSEKQADEHDDGENKINTKIQEKLESEVENSNEIKEIIEWVIKNSRSNFLNLGEFVPLMINPEDYSVIKTDIKNLTDYKKIVSNVYSLCLNKIKRRVQSVNTTIKIDKKTSLLWDNQNSEAETNFEKNVEMLFLVPNTEGYYADPEYDDPLFSGIVETIKVHWNINERLLNNSIPKYDFMSQNGSVSFTLFDSFGLDHAHNANDTKSDEESSRIISVYKSIISSQDIAGVILLGTLSTDILESQNAKQIEIVPYIVYTNLSENPGLNVIFVLNHADKENRSRKNSGRCKVISEKKEDYKKSIEDDIRVRSLRTRFRADYVERSINNFINSICIYSSINISEKYKYIEEMNTETYEKIDRICRTFNRYGISWNDSLNKAAISQNKSQAFVEGFSKYINSSIKIISAKKKIDKMDDDNEDYDILSKKYQSLIRWNTAKALAGQWSKNNFGGDYVYSGKALHGGSYCQDIQDKYEIDQHPKETLKKHLMAVFNFYCQKNPYYPYEAVPFSENQTDGNRVIFIQKCMYDTISEFVGDEEAEKFLAKRINSLLNTNSIEKNDVERLNNSKKKIQSDDVNAEKFKEIFKEKVKANYDKFHKLAIDDEIREQLLKLLGENRCEFENSKIRDILAGVINKVSILNLESLDLSDELKPRLREMVNEMQILTTASTSHL